VTDSPIIASGLEFFERAIAGEEYLGSPFLSGYQIPFVFWSLPIRTREGNIIGVMSATIDLSGLWDITSRVSQGQAYIVDHEGILLVSRDLRDVQKQQSLVNLESVRLFLAGEVGVSEYTGLGGRRVVGFWKPITLTPWAIVVEVPVADIFKDSYISLAAFLVFIFVIVGIVGYEARLFNRKIFEPITLLRKGMERFGKGKLTTRIQVRAQNEFAILADVFNNMALQIAEYPLKLEVEVKKRTKELNKVNKRLKELLDELYVSSKVLVQKDRELVRANIELTQLNRDADEVGKMLVRRDLELSEANTRLEELDVVKSEFVSVAAHQLRTPLTGIRWSFRALLEEGIENLTPGQEKIIRDGLQVTLSAVDLVADLLDIARIEAGRFDFTFTTQPLATLMNKVLIQLRKNADEKGISFKLDIPGNLPHVFVDGEKMETVLENIIDNAIKYTPPGGKVTVVAKKEGSNIKIDVTDTGIGIPQSQQHRLFSKFFRGDNAILFQTSGTGLGLYMVKNIIEKHDGTIAIVSEENKGTKVTLMLPIAEEKK